ncbi:MAG: type VI secretion system baseplate subunit TssK [Holosporaceae bacterium]|jgi:type VI secretion system protein ImpJ|nr:type VI secretion system baseplate subunit TssK [Holosporaceae bacterium]
MVNKLGNNTQSLIQWHEGMLLSPQHFQQLENYNQHLFGVLGSSCSIGFYGVHALKIDTAALVSGVVRILGARGIFPDGCHFDFDAVYDEPVERNLAEYFLSHTAAVKIYLAIPSRRVGTNLLTGEMARYYSDEITNINDENTGENGINIPVLKPKLRLLTSDEVDARYVSFPIFEVEKSVDGGVVSTKFIPPLITIDEHSEISAMCREIIQLMRSKIAYFSDRKDNYTRITADESLASLRLLVQAVLPLEAMVRINGIQPFEMYKCLLMAVTNIVAVNPTQLIPQMPHYNHNDLFATFDGLLQYATAILSNLKQRYDIIKFAKDGPIFKLTMKKEWLEKNEIFIGVQKPFSALEDDLINWINGAQIASESMISAIRDRRVLGADRSIQERGAYITQPNNMKIIAVKTTSVYIRPAEKLCLANNALKFIPEEIVLYAD